MRILIVAATRPEVEPLIARIEQPVAHHRVLSGGFGAHKVDVRPGVERHAPQHGRSGVAELARHKAMGGLVQGDGKDHRQRVNGNGLDERGDVHGVNCLTAKRHDPDE